MVHKDGTTHTDSRSDGPALSPLLESHPYVPSTKDIPFFELDMFASLSIDDPLTPVFSKCDKPLTYPTGNDIPNLSQGPVFPEKSISSYHNRGKDDKLDMCFLNPAQKDLRHLLNHVLTSSWFQNNEREPEDGPKRSILSPFLQRSEKGNSYKCLFDFCPKSFDRQDRALGHVRMHLGHRPFQCVGRCGASEWYVTLLMVFHVLTDLSVPVKSVSFVCPTCRVISNDLKIYARIGKFSY